MLCRGAVRRLGRVLTGPGTLVPSAPAGGPGGRLTLRRAAVRSRPEPFDRTFGAPHGRHLAGGRRAAPRPSPSPAIVELIRAGTLDAELAATLWVLIEGRVPVIVAAARRRRRQVHAPQRAARLPAADRPAVVLAGAARPSTGCRRPGSWAGSGHPAARRGGDAAARPGHAGPPRHAVLLCRSFRPPARLHLGPRRPSPSGPRASATAWPPRSTPTRSTTSSSSSAVRRSGPTTTSCRGSGWSSILRRLDDVRRRVAAAHYVRPTARDEHGHTQRLGPAVLATWDPATDHSSTSAGASRPSSPGASTARPATSRSRSIGAATTSMALPAPASSSVDAVRTAIRRLSPPYPDPPPSPTRILHADRQPRAPPPSPSSAPRAGVSRTVKDELRANLLAPPRRRRGGPADGPRLRGDRPPGHRERDPRRSRPRLPGRARPGQDPHGPAPRRPARRVAAGRPRRRAQRRPVRARLARPPAAIVERDGDDDRHRLAAARPALRREARDARHHHRRPHRRGRPDQGRRGPLPRPTS